MRAPFLLSLLFLEMLTSCRSQHGLSDVTYDERYLDGMKAYTQEKWSDCIIQMRQAWKDYERLHEASLKCMKQCEKEEVKVPEDYHEEEELAVFHKMIAMTACLHRCKEDEVGVYPRGGVTSYVENHMRNKDIFNYLQMALSQIGQVREAAQASATFSYANPENAHVKVNTRYYENNPDVMKEDLIPQYSLPYRDLYYNGSGLYHEKQWQTMVGRFEASLKELPKALERCREDCFGAMRLGRRMDFAQTMIHMYISLKECQSDCINQLGNFRYDKSEDFFGSYFHYLQYGYHMLDLPLPAIQASATQVRLEPHSEVAQRNAVFYRQQSGVTRKDFIPREDVMPMIEAMELEHAFMHILDEQSGHLTEFEEERVLDEESQDNQELLEKDFALYPPTKSPSFETWQWNDWTQPNLVRLTTDPERVVLDNVLSQEQCDRLLDLTKHAKEGDGYSRKSPHTYKEIFEGLHILDAAKKSQAGELDPALTQLYVNASRRSRDAVAEQFHLETPLYFSYTHLVCRTAKEGSQNNRRDLSHPVHSDNCILNEATGECDKVRPAYTWRDYSAILYLNEEFDGGEFFFAHSTTDLTPQEKVNPKCGRLVGFSAGKENMHGVLAVTGGKRCAVALWFTLDPEHKEASFPEAEEILRQINT